MLVAKPILFATVRGEQRLKRTLPPRLNTKNHLRVLRAFVVKQQKGFNANSSRRHKVHEEKNS